MMGQFSDTTNPFRRRIPAPLRRSNLPGYVVEMPDTAFIAARKQQDQATDQDPCKVYHNALKALYQLGESVLPS